MFGGLTKTSSRIAIAAAFGMFGAYAMSAPANAADFGGDCCADLEERVAELEATTVRKGNKKVSVTLSGWVVKSMNWWSDGESGNFYVGDKDADLASRFAITGSATIAPGWSAGYNLTVAAPSTIFGIGSNQYEESSGVNNIYTLYSYMFVKSDTWGALNWGYLSPASDNPAVLADISGTVIESNSVAFEGPGFVVRPSGNNGLAAGGLTWGSFLTCNGLGAGIGVDCWGGPQSAVRYDSPTWAGFRMETSYGTNDGLVGRPGFLTGAESNFWDIALFYNEDWGNFRVSAAYAYTWVETAAIATFNPAVIGAGGGGNEDNLHQVGATFMHTPSGLGIYGMYQYEDSNVKYLDLAGNTTGIASTDAWFLKPFIKRSWNDAGATTFFGEYGQYNDQYGGVAGTNVCGAFNAGTGVANYCTSANAAGPRTVQVSGSEVETYGLGVVQEIDAAAMHLWGRWRHMDVDAGFRGYDAGNNTWQSVNQGYEGWDLFQAGGIIFF